MGDRRRNNKQAVYLFIYPENVQLMIWEATRHSSPTIQDTAGPRSHSLCFSMSRPPVLIIPKDCPLESKNKTQNLLTSILALARATRFTAYFNDQVTDRKTRQLLASVASAFSERRQKRPLVNKKRANIATLYAGSGGQIFQFDSKPSLEECPPPSYNNVALSSRQTNNRKRRCTSEPSPDNSELVSLLKTINDKIDTMGTRLDNMGTRLDNMTSRMTKLETLFEDQPPRIHPPCRYGTEEKEDLEQGINERLDDSILDIRLEVQDHLNDAVNEAKEEIESFKNGAPEIIKQVVDQSVKDLLGNAGLEFNGKVSLKLEI